MNIRIDYATALAEFPKETAEAINVLRKSRSKHKNANPATLKWDYGWGVQVTACSFKDLLNGSAQRERKARSAMTVQERINDVVSRSFCTVSVAGHYHARLPEPPRAILKVITDGEIREMEEENRIEAMSDEERAAEVERLLNVLRGQPGFTEVRL